MSAAPAIQKQEAGANPGLLVNDPGISGGPVEPGRPETVVYLLW